VGKYAISKFKTKRPVYSPIPSYIVEMKVELDPLELRTIEIKELPDDPSLPISAFQSISALHSFPLVISRGPYKLTFTECQEMIIESSETW